MGIYMYMFAIHSIYEQEEEEEEEEEGVIGLDWNREGEEYGNRIGYLDEYIWGENYHKSVKRV